MSSRTSSKLGQVGCSIEGRWLAVPQVVANEGDEAGDGFEAGDGALAIFFD